MENLIILFLFGVGWAGCSLFVWLMLPRVNHKDRRAHSRGGTRRGGALRASRRVLDGALEQGEAVACVGLLADPRGDGP
jgi:hypothetical protein